MATTRRPGRISSSDSSGEGSSSDDDIPSATIDKSTNHKAMELSLKDNEDPIEFQAPLPEYYGYSE